MSKKLVPTDDELLAQFDDLGVSTDAVGTSSPTQPQGVADHDVVTELENLAFQRPASRPSTPQLKRSLTNTPPTDRTSEDKTSSRRSGDSTRPYHTSMTPTDGTTSKAETPAKSPDPQPANTGGGWWGGIFATASAAMKQAEAAVKEIQKNEEAQKWAEHVRGNVGVLKGLGGELKTLAMPTFTSFIHTLAPPISSHERLQIHITHDLRGYPSLDLLIYNVFSRVMAQVEGGDLLVIQRGQESGPKRGSESSSSPSTTAGWNDGPWWRYVPPKHPRSISAVKNAVVATKLVRASAESYANEYYASRGGVEEAARQASEILSETNPVRNSDIFLSIQAISQAASSDLFQAGPTSEKENSSGVVESTPEAEDEITFAVYLHDPVHGIAFHTISQPIPQKWIEWLDAHAPEPTSDDHSEARFYVPEAIAEIIESGGVDPREWVAEWVEDVLNLAVGVIAQRYVARRMGVGEGGVGKGKMRAEQATVVESGAGEAARAI